MEVKYVPVEVEEEEPEEQQIFQVVEEMPEFPGGMAECLKFLGKNIKYPTISQENGVQGKYLPFPITGLQKKPKIILIKGF